MFTIHNLTAKNDLMIDEIVSLKHATYTAKGSTNAQLY